jgi:hypothetical protein
MMEKTLIMHLSKVDLLFDEGSYGHERCPATKTSCEGQVKQLLAPRFGWKVLIGHRHARSEPEGQ